MFTLLVNLAAFVVAFVLVCAGMRALLPDPEVPIVSTKLNWLAAHGDEYNSLFIGSSRTFRQLLPQIFDTEMAVAGHPLRSFNAGVDGMRPPEDTYLLEKILAHRTKPLRLVVVECNPIRLRQREEDRDTLRAVYWHDNKRMGTMFRAAFLADGKRRSWGRRFEKIADSWPDFSEHAGYWMWRNTNLGRGHDMLAKWFGVALPSGLLAEDIGELNDGFKPFAETQPMNQVRIEEYERQLSTMLENADRSNEGDPVSIEEVRAKRRLIERYGARMVLVIPPFVGSGVFHPKTDDGLPPVLDFSSPVKYPELFSVEHRSDTGHTNIAGSKLYTRLVVRELLLLLKKESGGG